MSEQVTASKQVLKGAFAEGDPFNDLNAVQTDETPQGTPEPKLHIDKDTTIISAENLDDFIKGKPTTEASPVEAAVKVEEAQKEEEKPVPIKMTADTLIEDPRDGKIRPWKEIEGQTILQGKYQEKERALSQAKQVVDQNMPYLMAIDKSKSGKVFATALASGATEDEALDAALATMGKSRTQEPQPKVDPEPIFPPPGIEADDPLYLKAFQDHQSWLVKQSSEAVIDAKLKPFLDRLEARDKAEADKQSQFESQQKQAVEIQSQNAEMLRSIGEYLPFDINTLTEVQQQEFFKKIDETSARTGLDQIAAVRPIEVAHVKALAWDSFQGKNPFAAVAPKPEDKPQQPAKLPLQPGSSGASLKEPPSEYEEGSKEWTRQQLREMAL